MFVSNHPYEAGMPHVSDMAFIAPIFAGGEIVAFSGSIAHKADVGGAVPGSTSANATEMYHEGILLPPIKIWAEGKPLPDVERIILTNSRQPVLMRGDIHAQIAATQMGVERVKQLCERFGAKTLTDVFAAILKGAADELRAAIAKLPEGTSTAEGYLDSDGIEVDKPIKLAVTIAIKDGLAHFDFSDCAPQAKGPVNLRPSMVEACVFYSLIGSLGPDIAYNDGMRDVVRIKYAPHTIVNADPPGPVSSYQMVNLALTDVILEALAHFNPARALGAFRRVERAQHRLEQGPARPDQPAVRDRRLGLWRRHGPRRRDRDGDPSEQPAYHADRGAGIRVPLPHHPLRPGAGFRRRRPLARRARHAARIRAPGRRGRDPPLQQDPLPAPRASPAARTARAPASWCGSAPTRNSRRRPRRGSRCWPASGSCCKARAAAATAIRASATARRCSATSRRASCRRMRRPATTGRTSRGGAMAFTSRLGVVGLVNPTMRPGPTEELIRLLPEGIGVIPLFLNIQEGTQAEFKRIVASYEPQVALLAEQECDLIHLIGAPPFMVLGRKGETKLTAAWRKKYRTPIFTVAQNHVAALRALGAKSIVGATYFPAKLNAIFAQYMRDAGFEVLAMDGIDVPFHKVQELPERQIFAHIKRSFRQHAGRRRDLHARLRLADAEHHRQARARAWRAGGASGDGALLGNPEAPAGATGRARASGGCWRRCRDGRRST